MKVLILIDCCFRNYLDATVDKNHVTTLPEAATEESDDYNYLGKLFELNYIPKRFLLGVTDNREYLQGVAPVTYSEIGFFSFA